MDDFFSKYVSKEAAERYNPVPSSREKNSNMKNQSELGKRGGHKRAAVAGRGRC